MIILIDGPEAAGKSKLAKRLARDTGGKYIHMDKPKTPLEKIEMFNMYWDRIDEGQNQVWDRCWYSEMVYGDIMRDKSYISPKQMHTLETRVKESGGGLIIHCSDDVLKLWDRCQERGEDYVTDIDTLYAIAHAYEYLMHNQPHILPVVRYSLSATLL